MLDPETDSTYSPGVAVTPDNPDSVNVFPSGDDSAARCVEVSLVAGALHLAGAGLVVDDAAEVGALLAERSELAAG